MTFQITANLQSIGHSMKLLRCNNGTSMQSQKPCWTLPKERWLLFWTNHRYGRNLGSLIWTKLEMPIKWIEASRFSLSRESAPYTMCCEGDFHCGIWHWWGNTAPHCTSNTDCKHWLLLHVLAAASLSRRERWHSVVQNPIILCDSAWNHTAAIVMDLLRRWQWEILEYPLCPPDMSPWNYYLFTKVKESLRGTQYNTRDELIRAIEWSIRNVNRVGCADGILHLPNIWQKVINKVHRCGTGDSMCACQAAAPGSIPGRDKFPGWGFFGVFPHL